MENLESGVSSDSATQKFSDNEYKEVKDLLETLPEKCDLKDEIALEVIKLKLVRLKLSNFFH